MKRVSSVVVVLASLAAVFLWGCLPTKSAPPELRASYQELKARLDDDTPGDSIRKLEAFKKTCAGYDLSKTVAEEIARLRAEIPGRYHMGRELAREGDFSRAESVLADLADNVPETEDGRRAKEFLAFDFYLFKAQRLMMERSLDEAEKTLQELLARNPGGARVEEAERLLVGFPAAIWGDSRWQARSTT